MQMDRAMEQLVQSLRREPTADELAQHLGWQVEQVLKVHASREKTQVSSLDAQDDEGMQFFAHLGRDERGYEDFEMREDLRHALVSLSEDERQLITLRFRDQLSQQATAKKMQLTQMQVSRMERRVLRTLKNVMQAV